MPRRGTPECVRLLALATRNIALMLKHAHYRVSELLDSQDNRSKLEKGRRYVTSSTGCTAALHDQPSQPSHATQCRGHDGRKDARPRYSPRINGYVSAHLGPRSGYWA